MKTKTKATRMIYLELKWMHEHPEYNMSWARARLLHIVADMDPDKSENNVIYCDTDSIYFDDTPRNRAIIAAWNDMIRQYNLSTICRNGTSGWCLMQSTD